VDNPKPEGHGFSRAIKAARNARNRSAEGRNEGTAEATDLLSFEQPPLRANMNPWGLTPSLSMKKTQKTPRREIELALRRAKEVL
jgi:hypothetical protein